MRRSATSIPTRHPRSLPLPRFPCRPCPRASWARRSSKPSPPFQSQNRSCPSRFQHPGPCPRKSTACSGTSTSSSTTAVPRKPSSRLRPPSSCTRGTPSWNPVSTVRKPPSRSLDMSSRPVPSTKATSPTPSSTSPMCWARPSWTPVKARRCTMPPTWWRRSRVWTNCSAPSARAWKSRSRPTTTTPTTFSRCAMRWLNVAYRCSPVAFASRA